MLHKTSVWKLSLLSILTACVCGSTALAGKEPVTVVVTPARTRVVQLVQDLYRMRDMQVVSYQGTSATDPVLYKWDGRSWKRTTVEEFQGAIPDRVVLIGDPKSLPSALVDASSRSENTRSIPTFDVKAIFGEFSKLFALSPSEMEGLAERNGITVVDRNEILRRYGKYYPGPGYDLLHGVAPSAAAPASETPKTVDKDTIPPEPELAPVKIEPLKAEQPVPVEKTPPAVSAPAKARIDIAPEEK